MPAADKINHPPVAPVDARALQDLADRLGRRRSTHRAAAPLGISPDRLEQLVHLWANRFDWRAIEAGQSSLGGAVTTVADGGRLHYLHVPAAGPASGDRRAFAVVLLHGWPDTTFQFRHLIPRLRDAGVAVVAPTAPGFGHSDEPAGELSPDLVARDVHELLSALGYHHYVVHGSDWGATIGATIAGMFPEAVAGLHLLQPPFDRLFLVDRATASPAEVAYLRQMDQWGATAVHVSAHLYQADTLAAAFDDSPVGLLAWLAEKYDAWSGPGLADDDIVAAVATMWFTGTCRSSIRLYSAPAPSWDETDAGAPKLEVPTAFALFPDDIGTPPREFCDRFFDVRRFTVMPRGGHWAALEEPGLLADDLIAWTAALS
ncbi:MAG: alpha/beta fold hydrolase [Acidimicrobiales bacterium]